MRIKHTMAVLGALLVVGCSDRAEEMHFAAMPSELSDCRVYYIQSSAGQGITVARCPLSTTTTQVRSGKAVRTMVTIDGVAYTPSEK